jgi:phenylpropionate dioxygenase-like ring-hydroxylating dioxygenase large terminal subunit
MHDWTRPMKANIGDLPLVVWKDPATQQLTSMVNICKHMGSRLDNGKITDKGKLQCQYHGIEFGQNDQFGKAVVHEGKVFWAYQPVEPTPPRIPFFNNPNYVHSFLELDMDASLPDCALNSMDVRHPEYVHRLGFGNSVPASNLKQYKYRTRPLVAGCTRSTPVLDRVGLAFDYKSNPIMQQINKQHNMTHNFHMYQYPSFSWSRVSFDKNHLFVALNLLPLEKEKTRWYVTISHNYNKSPLKKEMMKMLAFTIMSQDHVQMNLQHADDALKRKIMFERIFPDENVVLWLHEMMQSYEYPDTESCVDLYRSSSLSSAPCARKNCKCVDPTNEVIPLYGG